jgi:hypothetical protein
MKNKRTIILFFVVQTVFLLNCKKETVRNNTASQAMYDLITKDSLKFDSYIIKWNASSVDTMYYRGRSSNRQNLDTAWFKFNKDGTYKGYISLTYNYSANWEFLDNGSVIRLWSTNFDKEFNLLKLSKDTVEWLDPKTDSLFYRFIPK